MTWLRCSQKGNSTKYFLQMSLNILCKLVLTFGTSCWAMLESTEPWAADDVQYNVFFKVLLFHLADNRILSTYTGNVYQLYRL